jgi:hypothetical protein
VMLSESTAQLVENAAVLGDAEMVCITGSDKAVPAPPCGRVGLAGSSRSLGDESRWAPVGIGHVDGCTGARDRRSGVSLVSPDLPESARAASLASRRRSPQAAVSTYFRRFANPTPARSHFTS